MSKTGAEYACVCDDGSEYENARNCSQCRRICRRAGTDLSSCATMSGYINVPALVIQGLLYACVFAWSVFFLVQCASPESMIPMSIINWVIAFMFISVAPYVGFSGILMLVVILSIYSGKCRPRSYI